MAKKLQKDLSLSEIKRRIRRFWRHTFGIKKHNAFQNKCREEASNANYCWRSEPYQYYADQPD